MNDQFSQPNLNEQNEQNVVNEQSSQSANAPVQNTQEQVQQNPHNQSYGQPQYTNADYSQQQPQYPQHSPYPPHPQQPYYNQPYGGAPQGQYPPPYQQQPYYGQAPMPFMPQPMPPEVAEQYMEHKKLKFLSGKAGLAILLSQLFSTVGSVLLLLPKFLSEITGKSISENFTSVLNMLLWIFMMGLPFIIVYRMMKKKGEIDPLPLEMPKKKKLFLLAIPSGFFLSMLANIVASVVSKALEAIGISSSSPGVASPTDTLGVVLLFISTAILPAFFEEFAFRGVVLQPLRRYGDKFAIVMSSFLFGLIHGNLIQGVFAFCIGLAIAYFVVATESIWIGVLIHFINNAFAVASTIITDRLPAKEANALVLGIQGTLMLIGFICTIIFIFSKDRPKLKPNQTVLPNKGKTKAYLSSGPMIATIIIMTLSVLIYMFIQNMPSTITGY